MQYLLITFVIIFVFFCIKSPNKVAKCMFLKLMSRSVKARRSCYDVCNESCLLPCNVRNHVY